jgi:hypothetical protein
MQANADGGALTIELTAGVYTLTIAKDNPANDPAVRDLDITGDITLRGVGLGATSVQAGPEQGRTGRTGTFRRCRWSLRQSGPCASGVGLALQHQWWHDPNQHGLGHARRAVAPDRRDWASERPMPNP